MDSFSTGQTIGSLTSIDDEDAVTGLVNQHVLQLRDLKCAVTSVAEGTERFWRVIEDNGGHSGLVVADNDMACEYGDAIRWRLSHVVD